MTTQPGLDKHKGDVSTEIESLAHTIIGCAIEAHRHLGPGLIERVYEDALLYELNQAGLKTARQVELMVRYKSIKIRGQRLDLVVESSIVIELKAVEAILPVHKAQLLSYLRASNLPLGLLLNFNTPTLKEGVRRVLNERAAGVGA